MSTKLFVHTLACAGLIFVLWFRLRHTTRRPAVLAFMAFAFILGAAPFMYRLGIPFAPRITISWQQLCFVLMTVVWFTPKPNGLPIHDALDEDDPLGTMTTLTTKPSGMPLH